MKKQLNILTALTIVLFFYSCSKEKSIDTTTGGGSGGGSNELIRQVYKGGNDSTELNFTYDGSKRLTAINAIVTESGTAYDYEVSVTRNSQGIIQQVVTTNDEFAQYGIDRLTYTVNYEGGRYKSKVAGFTIGTNAFRDSTAYEHDGTGKIIKERRYFKEATTPYFELAAIVYTYSGSNLTSSKEFSINPQTGVSENVWNTTFEYDTKTSPLILGNEAIVMGEAGFVSTNNITKQNYSDPTDPTANQSLSVTYTYNSANKPASGTMSLQPGGDAGTIAYYYR